MTNDTPCYIPSTTKENISIINSNNYQIPLKSNVIGVRSYLIRNIKNFIRLTKNDPIRDVNINPTNDFNALLWDRIQPKRSDKRKKR